MIIRVMIIMFEGSGRNDSRTALIGQSPTSKTCQEDKVADNFVVVGNMARDGNPRVNVEVFISCVDRSKSSSQPEFISIEVVSAGGAGDSGGY